MKPQHWWLRVNWNTHQYTSKSLISLFKKKSIYYLVLHKKFIKILLCRKFLKKFCTLKTLIFVNFVLFLKNSSIQKLEIGIWKHQTLFKFYKIKTEWVETKMYCLLCVCSENLAKFQFEKIDTPIKH
jgi:hypothetical protein